MLDDTLTRLLAGVLGTVLAPLVAGWMRAVMERWARGV